MPLTCRRRVLYRWSPALSIEPNSRPNPYKRENQSRRQTQHFEETDTCQCGWGLNIILQRKNCDNCCQSESPFQRTRRRSEEHTSELQSLTNLVCRLLLEKKK